MDSDKSKWIPTSFTIVNLIAKANGASITNTDSTEVMKFRAHAKPTNLLAVIGNSESEKKAKYGIYFDGTRYVEALGIDWLLLVWIGDPS